jgi:hypothetical protein
MRPYNAWAYVLEPAVNAAADDVVNRPGMVMPTASNPSDNAVSLTYSSIHTGIVRERHRLVERSEIDGFKLMLITFHRM